MAVKEESVAKLVKFKAEMEYKIDRADLGDNEKRWEKDEAAYFKNNVSMDGTKIVAVKVRSVK